MKVKITYLQLLARPQWAVLPPRDGLAVVHARKPTVAYYRFLYDAVGRDYDWTSRKKLSDAELAALLNAPLARSPRPDDRWRPDWLCRVGPADRGRDRTGAVRPDARIHRSGLGGYFLQWTIEKAWPLGDVLEQHRLHDDVFVLLGCHLGEPERGGHRLQVRVAGVRGGQR